MSSDNAAAEDPDSMEDILHSIRDIIASGEEDEVAEEPVAEAEDTPATEPTAKAEPVAKKEEPAASSAEVTNPTENNNPENEEDVLELTEIVNEATSGENDESDILSDIDAALGGEEETEQPSSPEPIADSKTEAATESAPVVEVTPEIAADTPPPIANETYEEKDKSEPEVTAEEENPEPDPAPDPEPTPIAEETPEVASVSENIDDEAASIISDQAKQAASGSLQNLLDAIPKPSIDSPSLRSGATLEDLIVESMRPMLSEWMDNNLSTIVEDIVQKEIKKILPDNNS